MPDDSNREDGAGGTGTPDESTTRERETVLITGASSGIGRATARAFHDEEWVVYATARDPEDLADLADLGCRTAPLDVTDGAQVDRVVDRIVEETGRIDCLVNNAGYAQYGATEDVPVADLHEQYEVNVYGPHRLVRAAVPHMRAAEEGTVITLSTAGTAFPHPGGGPYLGSKAAIERMSDVLRTEVDELDVVVVKPGPVETDFYERAGREVEEIPRSEGYESLYGFLDDVDEVDGFGPLSIQPERVAEVVVDAAVDREPDPQYLVGPVARAARYGGLLPPKWRTRLWRLLMRFT